MAYLGCKVSPFLHVLFLPVAFIFLRGHMNNMCACLSLQVTKQSDSVVCRIQ